MKKALLAALCFIVVGFALVSGTFATPDLNAIFADLRNLLGTAGLPEFGGEGTSIDVSLVPVGNVGTLYPGASASRTVYVANKGTGDAYCRLVYAVQYDEELWNNLTIAFTPGEGFRDEGSWLDITVSGVPYKMKVFTYTNTLTSGKTTPQVTITITMDEEVTSAQMDRLRSDFLQMQVLAIETAAFVNPETGKPYTAVEALDLALPLKTLNPF